MRNSKVYLPPKLSPETTTAPVKPVFVAKASRFATMAPGVRYQPPVARVVAMSERA